MFCSAFQHTRPVTVPFSRCLKGPLSLSPTYGTMQCFKNSYAFHLESRHSLSVSPSCARAGIPNACLTARPPQLQRTEDSGFPHRAAAAAHRRFCLLGLASNVALWPDNYILFNSLKTLDDTKSATQSQWIVRSWEHGGRLSRPLPSRIWTAHSSKQVKFNINWCLWAEEKWFFFLKSWGSAWLRPAAVISKYIKQTREVQFW